ncbi:MAG: hypothetical protein HKL80_07690 [Acidimicrobiales bacterium]|nr:hypothetical protein [Acidimicrobiales bacterium]
MDPTEPWSVRSNNAQFTSWNTPCRVQVVSNYEVSPIEHLEPLNNPGLGSRCISENCVDLVGQLSNPPNASLTAKDNYPQKLDRILE